MKPDDLRPHSRYKRVFFDENWLEDYLLRALAIKWDTLYSKSEFNKDRGNRAIIFWALYKFGGLGYAEIGNRFGANWTVIKKLVYDVGKGCWHSKRMEVIRSLTPYLPVKQANHEFEQTGTV